MVMRYIYIIMTFLIGFTSVACANEEDSLKVIMSKAEKGDAISQNIVGTWYYKGEHYAKDFKMAHKWWAKSAVQNNVEATGNLGLLYQYGRGVDADSVKALRCYYTSIKNGNTALLKQREALAEKGGDAFNSILVAICYQEGYGVKQSSSKAVHFFELAAKCKSVDAYRELGFIYLKNKKNNASLNLFEKAAAMDDKVAAYQYAKAILSSQSQAGKEQQAIVYLQKAAESGNVHAQCDLGSYYYQGKYVTKDPENAVKWFKKAAVGDWALAQWNLALCYIDGVGVGRDFDQAIYWLGKASAKGYIQQFEKMCGNAEKGWKDKPFMTYLKGMSLYFNEDIAGAYNEFKSIKKNIVEAHTMMSVCLANKNYKKRNVKKAVKELSKSVEAGNPIAMFFLASLYEAGNGIENDKAKALELYRKSADGGYATAQCYLGNLYYEGRIVQQDYSEAVKYYQEAESQGQLTETAAIRYAQCFEKGLGGMKVDVEKAKALKKKDFKNHTIPMLQKVK